MGLLQELKDQYDEQLAAGEKIPIKIDGLKGEYFVVKGVISANRKNRIAVAFQDGPLAYAAAVVINTLRNSDGKYELMGVTVKSLLESSLSDVIDDLAFEIQQHVLIKDDDDVANIDEVVVAKGNLSEIPSCGQDSV